jgi:hypothetical protein
METRDVEAIKGAFSELSEKIVWAGDMEIRDADSLGLAVITGDILKAKKIDCLTPDGEPEILEGGRLEQFKRVYQRYITKMGAYAKLISGERRAADVTKEEMWADIQELKRLSHEDLDRIGAIVERTAPAGAADILKKPAIVELREYMIDRARAALSDGAEAFLPDAIRTLDRLILHHYSGRNIDKEGLFDYHKDLQEHKEYGFLDNLLTFCWAEDGADNNEFISLIEKVNGEKVRNWKHLQELTGIEEITGHEGKIKIGTPEAKEEARRELSETLKHAVEYRYRAALEAALNNGAKYKDLLEIDPEAFGITGESIMGTEDAELARWDKETYQKEKIRESIGFWAFIDEGSYMRPDLHTIAEKLEAPYNEIWLAAEKYRF